MNELWISSLNSDLLLAQGPGGRVYRTDDGGKQWRMLYVPQIDYGGNSGTEIEATVTAVLSLPSRPAYLSVGAEMAVRRGRIFQ